MADGLQTGDSVAAPSGGSAPKYHVEDLFPFQPQHVHSASVVECPNGDLLACWFQGSGERKADDVRVMGSRKRAGADGWSEPFLMADVPDFPDCNPMMFIDPRGRLWLMWVTIIANLWESAVLKYRISYDYMMPEGPPNWAWQDDVHPKPDERFGEIVKEKLDAYLAAYKADGYELSEEAQEWVRHVEEKADDKYFSRAGWMPRNPPTILGERLIVPLYSDGYSFSLMAITDNWGKTWTVSEPLVGAGNIQPSIAVKKDGTLVAYMRDNGPPPKRLHVSESTDRGLTWGPVRDSNVPNPGTSAGVINLPNGHWLLVYNDLEAGRHSLAVSVSTDEGETWRWTRHLEVDPRGTEFTRSHYPTVIAARDGSVHLVYSQHHRDGDASRKTIRYVHLNEAWVREGDA